MSKIKAKRGPRVRRDPDHRAEVAIRSGRLIVDLNLDVSTIVALALRYALARAAAGPAVPPPPPFSGFPYSCG